MKRLSRYLGPSKKFLCEFELFKSNYKKSYIGIFFVVIIYLFTAIQPTYNGLKNLIENLSSKKIDQKQLVLENVQKLQVGVDISNFNKILGEPLVRQEYTEPIFYYIDNAESKIGEDVPTGYIFLFANEYSYIEAITTYNNKVVAFSVTTKTIDFNPIFYDRFELITNPSVEIWSTKNEFPEIGFYCDDLNSIFQLPFVTISNFLPSYRRSYNYIGYDSNPKINLCQTAYFFEQKKKTGEYYVEGFDSLVLFLSLNGLPDEGSEKLSELLREKKLNTITFFDSSVELKNNDTVLSPNKKQGLLKPF